MAELPGWTQFDPTAPPSLPDIDEGPGRIVAIVTTYRANNLGWAGRVAADLAAAWSASGHRVVLADGGLDEPQLHEVFGATNREGLADAALYGASVRRVARPVRGGSFFFVSAGTAIADPDAALRSPRWTRLCESFRSAGVTLVVFVSPDDPARSWVLEVASDVVVLAGPDEDVRILLDGAYGLVRGVLGVAGGIEVAEAPPTPEPVEAAPHAPGEQTEGSRLWGSGPLESEPVAASEPGALTVEPPSAAIPPPFPPVPSEAAPAATDSAPPFPEEPETASSIGPEAPLVAGPESPVAAEPEAPFVAEVAPPGAADAGDASGVPAQRDAGEELPAWSEAAKAALEVAGEGAAVRDSTARTTRRVGSTPAGRAPRRQWTGVLLVLLLIVLGIVLAAVLGVVEIPGLTPESASGMSSPTRRSSSGAEGAYATQAGPEYLSRRPVELALADAPAPHPRGPLPA